MFIPPITFAFTLPFAKQQTVEEQLWDNFSKLSSIPRVSIRYKWSLLLSWRYGSNLIQLFLLSFALLIGGTGKGRILCKLQN